MTMLACVTAKTSGWVFFETPCSLPSMVFLQHLLLVEPVKFEGIQETKECDYSDP